MVSIESVIKIHNRLIDEFGGSSGVRDKAGLEAALARPFSGFGDKEFYPEIEAKAAAIFQSIIISHPFVDGNKRIALFLLERFLNSAGKVLLLDDNDAYDLPNDVAMGKYTIESLTEYIKANSDPLDE
jgi:death-on-curing protein